MESKEQIIGKLQIKTFALPPRHFDPLTAEASHLTHYGLPVRPDAQKEPHIARLWNNVFSRKLEYVTPALKPIRNLKTAAHSIINSREANMQSYSFSGVQVGSISGEPVGWIAASWNVPSLHVSSIPTSNISDGPDGT